MLRVRLLRDDGGGPLTGFLIEGHADFGAYGADIVCAGVSALAQGALFGLLECLGDSVMSEKRDGYLTVVVDAGDAGREGPKAVLKTFELGIRAVERSYPGTVEVTEETRR